MSTHKKLDVVNSDSRSDSHVFNQHTPNDSNTPCSLSVANFSTAETVPAKQDTYQHADPVVKKNPVWLVMVVIFIVGTWLPFLPLYIYLPIMARMVDDLNTTEQMLKNTFTMYNLGFAIAVMVWGPLSDRFGRKSVCLFATLGILAATIGCSASFNVTVLTVFRFFQGLFCSCLTVVGRAIPPDCSTGHELATMLAFFMIGGLLSTITGPLIGSFLHDAWGWRSVFYFIAAACVLALIVLVVFTETHPLERRTPLNFRAICQNYYDILKNAEMLACLTTNASNWSLFLDVGTVLSFILTKAYDVDDSQVTYVFVGAHCAILVYTLTAALLMKFSIVRAPKVLLFSILWQLAAALIICTLNLFGGMVIFVVTIALVECTIAVVDSGISGVMFDKFGHILGTTSALIAFVKFAVSALTTYLISTTPTDTPWWLIGSTTVLAIICSASFFIARMLTRNSANGKELNAVSPEQSEEKYDV